MAVRRALAAAALLFPLVGPAAAETLTILHLNDFDGALEPALSAAGEPTAGAASLAALVKAERTPATLFLAAGDLLYGTELSDRFAGKPVVEVFNLMGLAASAVGNHEFDGGPAALRMRAAEARFTFLAANIAGKGPWKTSEIRRVGNLRVGLFGLTTVGTPATTRAPNVAGLAFTDPIAAARRLVPDVRTRADIVVALTHLGLAEDEKLAAEVPGIDVIVGGHTNARFEQPGWIGKTLVVQGFGRSGFLGRLDLDVANGRVAAHRYRLIPVTAAAGEDAAVAALVAAYRRRLRAEVRESVGADAPR